MAALLTAARTATLSMDELTAIAAQSLVDPSMARQTVAVDHFHNSYGGVSPAGSGVYENAGALEGRGSGVVAKQVETAGKQVWI